MACFRKQQVGHTDEVLSEYVHLLQNVFLYIRVCVCVLEEPLRRRGCQPVFFWRGVSLPDKGTGEGMTPTRAELPKTLCMCESDSLSLSHSNIVHDGHMILVATTGADGNEDGDGEDDFLLLLTLIMRTSLL